MLYKILCIHNDYSREKKKTPLFLIGLLFGLCSSGADANSDGLKHHTQSMMFPCVLVLGVSLTSHTSVLMSFPLVVELKLYLVIVDSLFSFYCSFIMSFRFTFQNLLIFLCC